MGYVNRPFAAGIDLHGTLLDESWEVPARLGGELEGALRSVRPFCELFLCTGNDLTFLHDHIDSHLLDLFDGFVLETGCVASDGASEEVLVSPEVLSSIKGLETQLRDLALPGVRYFARRLATISLFTKTEEGGSDPARLFPEVVRAVAEMGREAEVLVTHSDVAVDILPVDFNKFKGLRLASEAPSLIGIADSLNDLHLIEDADYSFLPANASPALLETLESRGREVIPLQDSRGRGRGTIAMSGAPHTEAVIQILQFLSQHFQ
jgi:hydroxymethylpyrimidine pyrophosphatase-like HAD family hydrolase